LTSPPGLLGEAKSPPEMKSLPPKPVKALASDEPIRLSAKNVPWTFSIETSVSMVPKPSRAVPAAMVPTATALRLTWTPC